MMEMEGRKVLQRIIKREIIKFAQKAGLGGTTIYIPRNRVSKKQKIISLYQGETGLSVHDIAEMVPCSLSYARHVLKCQNKK